MFPVYTHLGTMTFHTEDAAMRFFEGMIRVVDTEGGYAVTGCFFYDGTSHVVRPQ